MPYPPSYHKLNDVTGEPPLNIGASQVSPIYEPDVMAALLASDVGGSGIWAARIKTEAEYWLIPIILRA